MSTPSQSLSLMEQLEATLNIAEKLAAQKKALLFYINACQRRENISKAELLILKDIIEIMASTE